MGRDLRAVDVAAAIRDTLARTNTKAQLGKWAHLAMLADDARTSLYDHKHRREIQAALYRIMMMEEGPEYELDDAELQAMMEHLDRLSASP